MFPRATSNTVAGHIWSAGRYLPTPVLSYSFKLHILRETHSVCPIFSSYFVRFLT